jgi:hypothetical protein
MPAVSTRLRTATRGLGTLDAVRLLTTPRWIARHLLAICLVVAFLALGWWQFGRAADGNTLSYGYAVEWPVFAGFVIFIWVREIRRSIAAAPLAPPPPPLSADPSGRRLADNPAYADDDDAALAAYNAYLRWLNDNPGAAPADYPLRRA